MNNLIKLEQVALFCFSIFLFIQTDFTWWWFPALILLPDLSMLGYLINPKIGALSYNFFHHQALALLILCLGWQIQINSIYLTGIILLGHSSMDRIFGYGLKYPDNFKHTHLGWIGKSTKLNQ
jgi:hypothetical protein